MIENTRGSVLYVRVFVWLRVCICHFLVCVDMCKGERKCENNQEAENKSTCARE